MHRAFLAIVLGVCAACLSSAPSSAATIVAPPGAFGEPAMMSLGPNGRAFAAGFHRSGITYVERDAAGHWGAVGLLPGVELYPEAVAWAADGSLLLVAYDQSDDEARRIEVFRRPPGGARFAAPTTVVQRARITPYLSTFDADADIAVLLYEDPSHMSLLTAARGGALTAPQQVESGTEDAALAVGGGRVVLAYYDFARRSFYVRAGAAGSPLAAPQLLASDVDPADVAAAVDDAGDATVVFSRQARGRLAPAGAIVVSRAASGGRFGSPAVLSRGRARFGPTYLRAAARGTTTAVCWLDNPMSASATPPPARNLLRVALARAGGRFEPGQAPAAPPAGRGGIHGELREPVLTVGSGGDVLLTYAFGNALHAAERSARASRFGPLHVLSNLGDGPPPFSSTHPFAVFGDGRPLVLRNNRAGALTAAARLEGPRPDPTPPRATVEIARGGLARLRTSNTIAVRVRCSLACLAHGRATLRGGGHRSFAQAAPQDTVLRKGATLTERFTFDPTRGAGPAREAHDIRMSFTVESRSGVSSEVARRIALKP